MKKLLKDTLIIIAVTLAMLALIELALRVFAPGLKDLRYKPASVAFQHNEKYLVALKPNVEKLYNKGGAKVIWKTNSLGFRGEEIGEKTRPRVIVYGDSNVHARFSPDAETYPVVIEQQLRNAGINMQVINAGMTGSGPDQSLLRLQEDFDKVQPDIVIIHVFADNDYGDIIKNRLFKLNEKGELIKSGFPVTVDKRFSSFSYAAVEFFSPLYIQGAINFLVSNSSQVKENSPEQKEKTFHLLEENNAVAYEIYAKDQPRQLSHFKDYYDIDIATRPESESAQTKIALMEKVLEAANSYCVKKKIKLLVVVQPSALDLTLRPHELGYQDLAQKYKSYSPTNLTNPLKMICEKHHLNCVHLIDSYKKNEPDTLYRDDDHWNAKGQQIAAEETLRKILLLMQSRNYVK